MNKNTLIQINNAVPRIENIQFKTPINWTIHEGEHWAVLGANGAGKTLLADILARKHALKSGEIETQDKLPTTNLIKSVAFKDIYSLAGLQNGYYQQRWNTGCEQETPTIDKLFSKGDPQRTKYLIDTFAIQDLIEKPIHLLSSGELRKTLIIRALLSHPRILILDNPYIGLDAKSRTLLDQVFSKLASITTLQLILLISDPNDIPSIITHIQPISQRSLHTPLSKEKFLKNPTIINQLFQTNANTNIPALINPEGETNTNYQNALLFKNISIRYGERTILNNLNWQVKRGEKWALLGENGSGKSTLLSLVAADNPQAYANNITLFDHRRGTGESIWDIKKNIGYISPEMHLYYMKNVSCINVVGSGFFDTIGLYRTCNDEQTETARRWMETFGIEHLKDTSFLNISNGEQRLVLLARLFVKNPSLLILDEPLHGLDIANKRKVLQIIDQFCTENKALIYVTHYEGEIPPSVNQRLTLTKYP